VALPLCPGQSPAQLQRTTGVPRLAHHRPSTPAHHSFNIPHTAQIMASTSAAAPATLGAAAHHLDQVTQALDEKLHRYRSL
jgi:hypothetical protein